MNKDQAEACPKCGELWTFEYPDGPASGAKVWRCEACGFRRNEDVYRGTVEEFYRAGVWMG